MLLSTMLLIARTDAESAKLISSNIDALDHQYIMGTTKSGKALAETLSEAEAIGKTGPEIDALEAEWIGRHELCTFDEDIRLPRSLTQAQPSISAPCPLPFTQPSH